MSAAEAASESGNSAGRAGEQGCAESAAAPGMACGQGSACALGALSSLPAFCWIESLFVILFGSLYIFHVSL